MDVDYLYLLIILGKLREHYIACLFVTSLVLACGGIYILISTSGFTSAHPLREAIAILLLAFAYAIVCGALSSLCEARRLSKAS